MNVLVSGVILATIGPDDYVREVLPGTHGMWGGKRSFESYADEFRAMAASAYLKRRRFTVGLRLEGQLVSSCKLYDREIRWGQKTLRATGIGAVFTPELLRGRGYASAMLGALLDDERAAGRDAAFLFSDIHPAFYERLGFITLPSRAISLRATSLDGSPAGGVPLEASDWAAVRRCFDALESERPWSFKRTPLVWDWMRGMWSRPVDASTQRVQLVVRRGRSAIAHALGRRVPSKDTFFVDDFGFEGEAGRAVLPALLRAAAGDLRRVGGWLPPPGARDVLPRGSVRPRKDAILMLAPLTSLARSWWLANRTAILEGRGRPVLERRPHMSRELRFVLILFGSLFGVVLFVGVPLLLFTGHAVRSAFDLSDADKARIAGEIAVVPTRLSRHRCDLDSRRVLGATQLVRWNERHRSKARPAW